jgi:hypothetical protein
MTNQELQNLLISLWGSTVKPFNLPTNPQLKDHVNLSLLSNENLIYLVDIFLHDAMSNSSGFSVSLDTYEILGEVMKRLRKIASSSRRLNPVLRCYEALFTQSCEIRGQFSLATMYIIAEIEYLLKKESSFLDVDGKIKLELPQSLRDELSSSQWKVGKQISQIGDILKIYCFENNSLFATYLKNFDSNATTYNVKKLQGCYNEINGVKLPVMYEHYTLFERVKKSRNLIMHGEEPYYGCEIFFFLSLHAIFFISSPNLYTA